MNDTKPTSWQTLLGLDWYEAKRRLQDAGADVCVSRTYGRKGPVEGADSERVIRVTQNGDTVEILLSSFRTTPTL